MMIAMNKHPFPSNDLSTLRSVVWIGILAATAIFWTVVAAALIALIR